MAIVSRTCIYCLGEYPASAFNVEHVIPRAFGTFQQNLPLHCVCEDCNSYFRTTIEFAYTRDSVEAILRLLHGIKPATQAADLAMQRVSIVLSGDSDWHGCHIELKAEDGQCVIDLVPQVRFARRSGSGWIFVTEEELTDLGRPLPADIDPSREIRLISRSREMNQRLISALRQRGISFQTHGETGAPPAVDGLAPLEIEMHFDAVILRCVAKVSFNYMAHVAGADFARGRDFDAVRGFIREGRGAGYPLVARRFRPILADDSPAVRQTNGHLVTVNSTRDSRHVVGQVSLFNGPTYSVSLARNYSGVWLPLRSGHHFDLDTGQISRLASASGLRL
jgi:hypothetical protein